MTKDIKMHREWCKYDGIMECEYQYYDDVDGNGAPIKVRHGEYKKFTAGSLSSDCVFNYKDGKLHGQQISNICGAADDIEAIGEFDNGTLIGTHKEFAYHVRHGYPTIKTMSVGTYVNGQVHGLMTCYLDDGTIISEAEFDNGVLINKWTKSFDGAYDALSETLSTNGDVIISTDWYHGKKTSHYERDRITEIPLYFEIYESAPTEALSFLSTVYHGDRDGNCESCVEYYMNGNISAQYLPVPHPDNIKKVWAPNKKPARKRKRPGLPDIENDAWNSESYVHESLLHLQYYPDGTLKQASYMDGKQFIGEFRYYNNSGKLLEHNYYHQNSDVLEDILDTADCPSIDTIDDVAMVFITLQYGALRLIPKEYLCPIKK